MRPLPIDPLGTKTKGDALATRMHLDFLIR